MKLFILIFSFVFCSVAFSQNALNFDGVDDYISTTGFGVSGNNARTVEAWVRTTANTVGNQKVILDWGDMTPGHRFTFNLLQNNSVRLEVGGSGIAGNLAVNDGQWHHVAAVYDPSLVSGRVKLYIDGVLNTSGNLTQAVNTSSLYPVTIGVRNDQVNHFDGDIDEVRIWNVARSAAQIASQWNRSICSPVPSSLVAYYQADQGTAGGTNTNLTTLPDYSANANNGTLTNFSLSGASSNWVAGASLLSGITSSTISVSACNRYLSPAGQMLDSSGTYSDTLINTAGCDSIISISLQIDTVDISVNASTTALQANQNGATYKWLSCDNNFLPVAGATAQSFTPSDTSMRYAVEITLNSCVDTSACVQLKSNIGQAEFVLAKAVQVYPNPSKGEVLLSFPASSKGSVFIYNSVGQVVHKALAESDSCTLQLRHLPRGVYSIQLVTKHWKGTNTLVLQ